MILTTSVNICLLVFTWFSMEKRNIRYFIVDLYCSLIFSAFSLIEMVILEVAYLSFAFLKN